jgi:hypothetical protein
MTPHDENLAKRIEGHIKRSSQADLDFTQAERMGGERDACIEQTQALILGGLRSGEEQGGHPLTLPEETIRPLALAVATAVKDLRRSGGEVDESLTIDMARLGGEGKEPLQKWLQENAVPRETPPHHREIGDIIVQAMEFHRNGQEGFFNALLPFKNDDARFEELTQRTVTAILQGIDRIEQKTGSPVVMQDNDPVRLSELALLRRSELEKEMRVSMQAFDPEERNAWLIAIAIDTSRAIAEATLRHERDPQNYPSPQWDGSVHCRQSRLEGRPARMDLEELLDATSTHLKKLGHGISSPNPWLEKLLKNAKEDFLPPEPER